MRRTLWNCDRCQAEFEYSCEWGEQPINYVAMGGPPSKADLCECCSAKLQRFLAGAELERQPDEFIGVVRGENTEAVTTTESVLDDPEDSGENTKSIGDLVPQSRFVLEDPEDYGEDTRSSAEIAATVDRSLLGLFEPKEVSAKGSSNVR